MANKIIVTNQEILDSIHTKNITWEYKESFIPKLSITASKSTSLELQFDNMVDKKMEIEIHLLKNCRLQLLETKTGEKGKLLFRYVLEEKSELSTTKIHDVTTLQERDFFLLEGYESKVTSILKTVGTNKEKYDMTIQHNAKNSYSNILNHGVNIEGTMQITVTTCIPASITRCEASQSNRIINLTNNHCVIRPNLLIEEYDVTANHSAYIGPFTKEELFYLKRLGISSELAQKLLIKGFINSKVNPSQAKRLEKYWR